MAPRKRTTKHKQAKHDLRRQAKLDAILKDFDSEVKARVEQKKEHRDYLLKEVENRYTMALIKLPKAVRQMNWLEYFFPEKPKSPEVVDSKREEEVAELERVLAENHAIPAQSAQNASKNETRSKSNAEDENVAPQNTARKGKSTKRPPVKAKRTTRAQSIIKQTASTRKSNRKPLVTPARHMLDSSLVMGATPPVTPRFDPRLPKTPGLRVPRHKERVYSISVNGSPIESSSRDVVISVPVGNGESIQLLASQMDSIDLSSLDQTALQSIRRLQSRLATLCEPRE